MTINKAFLSHGIFTERSVTYAINRYAAYVSQNPANPPPADNIDRFINALKDMNISNVWIHLFSRGKDKEDEPAGSHEQREKLIARLNARNIPWAGWGYCAGYSAAADFNLIQKFRSDPKIAMKAFVIDAEPGNDVPDPNDPNKKIKDKWVLADFDKLVGDANQLMGINNLAISTWPILQFHDDYDATTLMKKAAGRVCLFAPQAYWMGHPSNPHYKFDSAHFTVKKYPRDDPTAFVRLVIDAWRILNFTNPLVISGQAYWELDKDGGSPSRETMEVKIYQLATKFSDWGKIVGFNWYHAGLANTEMEGSMSDDMIRYIGDGHFDAKPYQPG
jgi:hypothetical protein